MKSLFHSKDQKRSSFNSKPSSRSSSLTSGADSGIERSSLDGDVNSQGHNTHLMTGKGPVGENSPGHYLKAMTAPIRSNFRVEHLASFPLGQGDKVVSPKERLEKAKELIAKGEPWTKEMDLTVTEKELVLLDCETQELIERYPLSNIDSIQDVSDDPLLKSVLVFSTMQTAEKYAAVHLFQCDKVPANVIAPEVQKLMTQQDKNKKINGKTHGVPVLPPPPGQPAPSPPQGVAAFTAAVAQKDVGPRPPTSPTKIIRGEKYGEMSSPELMEAYINRDVQVLNHCIDDIEELVYRVKQVAEAWKQLEIKYYKAKKSKTRKQEAEAIEARSPTRDEFIDAFQKCKYAFILLGKLRPHIQNPSAAELVHYLIMPLSLLVRCTRGPQEASAVVHPLMTSESVELLRSTLTENETELWKSLGPAWTLSRSSPQWSKTAVVMYEPKFRSGWVPPEIVGSGRSVPAGVTAAVAANAAARIEEGRTKKEINEDARTNAVALAAASKFRPPSAEKSSPTKDAIFKRVKVVYSFTGKNPKELSVNQGEELMVLDDSRQWWCVRNSKGAVGFVPNTVLEKSGSFSSSNKSLPSPKTTAPTTTIVAQVNGNRHESFSSDSSLPVFSTHSASSSRDDTPKVPSKPPSPQVNEGANNFQMMIQSKSSSLKKVEDVPDGPPVANKRLSSADLLNEELQKKITSERAVLSPPNRTNSQESAIILSKQSTASDVQSWMKAKNFSAEAMAAVQIYSAEELGDMTKNDISYLVGDSEGKKLFTQLTIEKSGDCWHHIVVHRGVSELQAVMNRRKNISDGDAPVDSDHGGIRNIVKAAQSDRQNTWIERKLTKRGSLENLQKVHNERQANTHEMTRQQSYELRKKTEPVSPVQPRNNPVVPRVAPKPRPVSMVNAPYPIPPPPPPNPPGFPSNNMSQYAGVPPAPITSSNPKVDDLLREHQQQQQLLQEQQKQLAELRAQQNQKDQMVKYEENRIRLEQQVKDQEAMLKLLQDQQKQQQLRPQQITMPAQMTTNVPMQPQPTYVSYVPMPAYPGISPMTGVQGIPTPQPIYTLPPMYYQPK